MYRPPSTDNSEWIEALVSLDKDIKNAQAYGKFQRICMGGDFNFPNLKWDGNGKIEIDIHMNKQMEEFSILLNDYFLLNMVNQATRGNNILDLILTNDPESCIRTEIDLNIKFSDHNLVTSGHL